MPAKAQHSRQEHVAAFSAWLASHGAATDAVQFTWVGEAGLGALAARALSPEQRAIVVPDHLSISPATIQASSVFPPDVVAVAMNGLPARLAEVALLSAWLAHEAAMQETSAFDPYFDVLPHSLSSFPAHFSEPLAAVLAASPASDILVQQELQRQRSVQRQVEAALQLLHGPRSAVRRFPAGSPLAQVARWAVSIVVARALPFPVSASGTEHSLTLVPGIDCFNDAHPHLAHQTAVLLQRSGAGIVRSGFSLKVKQATRPGEEVRMAYFSHNRRRCAAETLAVYGFTSPLQVDDCAVVLFDMTHALTHDSVPPPLRLARRAKLVEQGFSVLIPSLKSERPSNVSLTVVLENNVTVPGHVLQFLRLSQADLADLEPDTFDTRVFELVAGLRTRSAEHEDSLFRLGGGPVLDNGIVAHFASEDSAVSGVVASASAADEGLRPCQTGPAGCSSQQHDPSVATIHHQLHKVLNTTLSRKGWSAVPVSNASGSGMLSWQNELRALRAFLRALVTSERSLLARLKALVEAGVTTPQPDAWSTAEAHVMRVHEGVVRTLRWHAAQAEQMWLRHLYSPELHIEPGHKIRQGRAAHGGMSGLLQG